MRKLLFIPLAALLGASFALLAENGVAPVLAAPTMAISELAALLKGPAKAQPKLLHIGFKELFEGGHIPGSIYAGSGSDAAGLKKLEKTVKKLPKGAPIVLYCGCCPWVHCPNVVGSSKKLKALGFKDFKVLEIPSSFEDDWVKKGLPVEKGR